MLCRSLPMPRVSSALSDFVRSSKLRGGTDLQKALQAGLQQGSAFGTGNPYLVLLSDGGATRGPIQDGKLSAWYAEAWKHLPESQRPRTYVYGVGDDANLPLLRELAREDGLLEHVLSTEPAEFTPIGVIVRCASPGARIRVAMGSG